MEQRTEDWFAARAGRATASNFKKVLAKVKSGEAADRRNYRAQLVVERLTGKADEGFENAAMRWGTEQEPFARIAYIAQTGNIVEEVGFIKHPTLQAGCSPDGLIGLDGGIEIKCPTKATHLDALKAQAMPPEHMAQVQGCMWITGRKWWDFVSYHPDFPEPLQLFITRVERDEKYIKNLEHEIIEFLACVDNDMEAVSKLAA